MTGGRSAPERRSDQNESENQSVRHPSPAQQSGALDNIAVLQGGNQAASRFFAGNETNGAAAAQAPRIWVPGRPVEVAWKQGITQVGGRRPGVPRPPGTMYVGDTYTVTAIFPKNYQAEDRGNRLSFQQIRGDDSFVKRVTWTSPTEATLTIQSEFPGSCEVLAHIAGNNDVQSPATMVRLVAVADADAYEALCGAASNEMRDIYNAGDKWFLQCFQAYSAGHKAHVDVLNDVKMKEKLRTDLMISLLMAGSTGIIGGMVSGVVGNAVSKMWSGNAGAITTLAEDLTKALVAIPQNILAPAEDAGGGGASNSSGALPGQAGATARGERESTADSPPDWRTPIEIGLKNEQILIGRILTRMQKSAYRAMTQRDSHPFRDNPLEIVRKGATITGFRLDRLPPVPAPEQYEAEFWAAWLKEYAYKVVPEWGFNQVAEEIPDEIKYRIIAIIKRLQELKVPVMDKLSRWIEVYGEPSRQAAEQRKASGKLRSDRGDVGASN